MRFNFLLTNRGSNAISLVDYLIKKNLTNLINKVIINNPNSPAIEKIKQRNIKSTVLDPQDFANTRDYNTQLLSIINPGDKDIIFLCGYMMIIPPEIIKELNSRIINIHPSLLPKYKGLNTHKRVLENKEAYHGCTVHQVNEGIDSGKLIAQYKIKIYDNDNEETLSKRLLLKEHILYSKVLEEIIGEKLIINENEIFYKNSLLNKPMLFE
ncbi:MAG: phosphoribosylglycinamide formyltransferase [Gammaproteobacteria bacterium]|jgi:phosphoribosylglycinamide formyltransferase-1|nr:phosphoribosylglycinamide formyltransferase [Gammaproteobacteria bacterium]|tara:strand:+ start:10240 stop:10872 length:633 start_codon:yes stop_codon:yes gene_type:complete